MYPFGHEHQPPWNRPPYNINHNAAPDQSLQRSASSPVHFRAPDLPGSLAVPPPPSMPAQTFGPPRMDVPFTPIEQRRDLFFENPKPRSYTFSARPAYAQRQHSPAPPVPPLPPNLHRHDTQPPGSLIASSFSRPVADHLVRTKSAPPVPPRPIAVAPPALPPKVPIQLLPADRLDTKPDIPSFPLQALPTHAPSPHVPSTSHRVDYPPALKPGPPSYPTTSTFHSFPPASGSSAVDVLPSKSLQPVIPEDPRYSEGVSSPDEESAALARALAISASESDAQRRLKSREDQDLARALQESMEMAESELPYVNADLPDPFLDDAEGRLFNDHALATSPPLSRSTSPSRDLTPEVGRPSPAVDVSNDEWYARSLIMEMNNLGEDVRPSTTPLPAADSNPVSNDELFARSLIVEDSDDARSNEFDPAPDTALPSYSEALLSAEAELAESERSSIANPTTEIPQPREPPPELNPVPSISIASFQSMSPVTESPIPSRSPSLIASTPVTPEPEPRSLDQLHPDTFHQNLRPDIRSSHSPVSSSPSSSSISLPLASHDQERNNRAPEIPSNPGPLQFLDPEFLLGVSIGFMNPTITAQLAPMKGVMPNIIALPYGRCPPLHIQAPSWRHLLRLMARLSNTRVEPTVEALAATKTTLHLRTVVQFVKAPDESWRTILWFTIDHPIPPGSSSWKWTNGDVNTLPWSYTLLTHPPHLLRDGSADNLNSKFYTIPSTPSTPWPTLPISFPNYVMYLQRVLDDSRRAIHDSSGGIRRLAKMIDQFYPEAPQRDDDDPPERSGGVGGLFKRVMGRGNKNKKGVNEDTYDLVTPFMPDGW